MLLLLGTRWVVPVIQIESSFMHTWSLLKAKYEQLEHLLGGRERSQSINPAVKRVASVLFAVKLYDPLFMGKKKALDMYIKWWTTPCKCNLTAAENPRLL